MFTYIKKIKKHDTLVSGCLAIILLYSACSPIRPFGVWPGILSGGSLIAIFYFLRKRIIDKFELLSALDIRSILILGIVIRILWIVFSGNTWGSDFARYDEISRNILVGNYLSDLEIPQGTSMITAFFYWIFGINRYAALFPIVFASVAMIYLVYLVAQKIFGETTARVSATLCSLCPEQILYTNLVNSDIYFAFFVLAAFWCLLALPSRHLVINAFLAGAFLGMSQYIRSSSILFLFSIALFLLIYNRRKSLTHAFGLNLALIAAYLLVLIPLIIFNYSNFKELTINSSRVFGWSFFLSTNPIHIGKFNDGDLQLLKERMKVSTRLPYEGHGAFKHRVAKEMAIERLMASPSHFIMNCFNKPYLFLNDPASFKWPLNGINSAWLVTLIFGIGLVYHRVLLVLCGIALFLKIRHSTNEQVRGFMFLTGCTVLLVTLSHFFLEIQTRYHYALMPYIIIVAAHYFTKRTGNVSQPVTNNP
jgi:4-amino-4-deoxy-L-arabinose transferase-like glycosyltransferase